MNQHDIVLYQIENTNICVNVVFENETFWMTQKAMAELFGVNVPAISKHLINIYEEEELIKKSTVSKMEYDYAIEQGIPVLVFAIDENIELASDKVETDKSKIEKLKMFRTKAMTNRLASIWATPEDLTGKLAISIMKARTEIKRPGWQRAVDFDEASLRREIMELKNENKKLADDLKAAREEISFLTEETDIAFEDCEVKIEYHYQSQSGLRAGSLNVSLQDLFITIATEMMEGKRQIFLRIF